MTTTKSSPQSSGAPISCQTTPFHINQNFSGFRIARGGIDRQSCWGKFTNAVFGIRLTLKDNKSISTRVTGLIIPDDSDRLYSSILVEVF